MVTGMGVLAASAIGKDNFFSAVTGAINGIKPISLFDTADFKPKCAGEITGFNPQDFLGDKGLRVLDRTTKLLLSASGMALQDAGIAVSEDNSDDIGVVVGSTMGSINSIMEFDKTALVDGPQYVNPALFPNTVFNSPASHVSIKFNIKGLNSTISTGFSASLDAIKYAADCLRTNQVKACLVAGVEELCLQTFMGFYKLGALAGISGEEINCPFDQRRNGVVLGEAAAVLILEELESAKKRQARIYAEVKGFGKSFDACGINKFNPQATGLKNAMQAAINSAKITKAEVSYVSAAANSSVDGDALEAMAIKEVLNKDVKVTAFKSLFGECYSASGLLQSAASVVSLEKQIIPATLNYAQKDARCDLNIVAQIQEQKVENVLVNAFGKAGSNASVVISKFDN